MKTIRLKLNDPDHVYYARRLKEAGKNKEIINDIPYTADSSGPGTWFTLFVTHQTTRHAISAATTYLALRHKVAGFKILVVPLDFLEHSIPLAA